MLLKKRKKSRVYRFYRPTPAKKRGAQKIDYAIFILVMMLGCFGISLAKKWGEGNNKVSSDEYTVGAVRIQILNASGNPYLAESTAKKLTSMAGPLKFEVVEKGNYGVFKLAQSLLVYLKPEEEELANLTADWLGINRENVLFQKVDNNYQDIQMKLIVGRDFKYLEVAQAE